MIIILKNITSSPITIPDLAGITIDANGQRDVGIDVGPFMVAHSNDLLSFIASGDIVVNNGSIDMTDRSDAIRYVSLYKHLNPISPDGKEMIRSDSRPINTESYFSMCGDSTSMIGGGTCLEWDFSNDDNLVIGDSTSFPNGHHMHIPDGYKRKRMVLSFVDPIYIKGGSLYYSNAPKWSWADFYVVCPQGYYYYDRDYNIQLATEDTPVVRYVAHKHFFGTCTVGDEVTSEGCQVNALPVGWVLWGDITVPITDTTSFGTCELEMYRQRSYLYPGEAI